MARWRRTRTPRRSHVVPRRLALDEALDASLAANIELIALPEVRDRILDVMERYSARRA